MGVVKIRQNGMTLFRIGLFEIMSKGQKKCCRQRQMDWPSLIWFSCLIPRVSKSPSQLGWNKWESRIFCVPQHWFICRGETREFSSVWNYLLLGFKYSISSLPRNVCPPKTDQWACTDYKWPFALACPVHSDLLLTQCLGYCSSVQPSPTSLNFTHQFVCCATGGSSKGGEGFLMQDVLVNPVAE